MNSVPAFLQQVANSFAAKIKVPACSGGKQVDDDKYSHTRGLATDEIKQADSD